MASVIRPARIAALYVEPGDFLVTAPADSRIIGMVVEPVPGVNADIRQWRIRTPSGEVTTTRAYAAHRPVWVHVPTGQV